MALTDFKPQFDNSYQEVFQKTLVAKEIANTRFKSTLSYGESIERVAFDISGVQVRDTVRGSASTIDTVTDSSELLTVNIEKEAVFHISDGEVKQAGPMNPGEKIGAEIAMKVAVSLDAKVFGEVVNALYDFDNGDLTTGVSDGTPITLSSTTVPQMVSRMPAKLRNKNNQMVSTNMCLVIDSYGASDVTQYVMGKNIDLAGNTFQNGYSGDVGNARMYVSENLTGEAVLSLATNVTAGDTITVNGVVFTARAVPSLPGEFDIGASADATRAIIANAINGSSTGKNSATGYFEVSDADRAILTNNGIVATNDDTANTLTLIGTGSGRITTSETLTDATDAWTKNFIHAYYGKKGAIDLVVQDIKEVDMRPTADRRGTNVFTSYLAGLKTFADGKVKFLDVLIKNV